MVVMVGEGLVVEAKVEGVWAVEMVGGSAVAGSVEGARAVAASVEWKEVVNLLGGLAR